jgi:hypothetical protein
MPGAFAAVDQNSNADRSVAEHTKARQVPKALLPCRLRSIIGFGG